MTKNTEVIDIKVTLIKDGCPLCGNDVRGNDDVKYLCKRCMMLFEERHLKKI